MKHQRILVTLAIGALPCAGLFAANQPQGGKPTVLTPPAIQNGSNWSRAPFPAQRQFDDVKGPDGQAVDSLPPNSESANTEPPTPAARVAIMQPAVTTGAIATTTTVDPGTLPTGRTTVVATPAAVAVDTRAQGRPTVLTPPAIQDGSNRSRAPFPAERRFDDVKSPDAVAVDVEPPSAINEPAAPPARVAIMQPATTPAASVAVTTADPGSLPTGRSNVTVATSLEAPTFAPTLRGSSFESRDQIVADVERRMSATDAAISSVRGTATAMSADGRRAFNNADDTVKEKAKALRKSIKAAQKASASEWENARAQLAADFDAYAAAVAQIDATTR